MIRERKDSGDGFFREFGSSGDSYVLESAVEVPMSLLTGITFNDCWPMPMYVVSVMTVAVMVMMVVVVVGSAVVVGMRRVSIVIVMDVRTTSSMVAMINRTHELG